MGRARTAASQANPSIVGGKFAFWRQLVTGMPRTEHPIGSALQQLLKEHPLDPRAMLQIIDAKEQDCYRKGFQTIGKVVAHYELTEGLLYQLIDHDACKEGLRHFGAATGLYKLLRSSVKARALGQDPEFPLDMIEKHGLLASALQQRRVSSQQLAPVVAEIHSIAQTHLSQSKKLGDIGLYSVVIERFLDQVQRADFDLEHVSSKPDGLLPLRLWFRHFFF